MNVKSIQSLQMEIDELQKELTFARDLLGSANSIVIRWGLDGVIHYMNDFGLRFFGYSPEELIGQHINKIIPNVEKSTGRDMFKLAKDIAKNPDQHISVSSENLIKDGRTVWVTWANKGVVDGQGNIKEILAIGNDITSFKQTERYLWEYKEKLNSALESMDDAVFISDSHGNLVHMNNAFATFHRFKDKTECTNQIAEYPDVLDVFFADGTPAPLDQWAVPRALRGESATNFEYSCHRKDTGETWVGNYNFGPFFDREGNIAGTVVVARDITEQKRAELELQEAKAELDSKNKYLEEANIALNVLIRQQEKNKAELEKNVLFNVENLLMPILGKLKNLASDHTQKAYMDVLESNLNQIVSSFMPSVAAPLSKLTPAQIRIANLIKQGMTTKEIAKLLSLSPATIAAQRQNIRKRLALPPKTSLRAVLLSSENH